MLSPFFHLGPTRPTGKRAPQRVRPASGMWGQLDQAVARCNQIPKDLARRRWVGGCQKPKAEECLHSRQPAEARLHSILDCVPATA